MQQLNDNGTLLEVENLKVSFPTPRGVMHAVNGISYDVRRGEVMGIIGESGSGKSVEAYSIMGLLKSPGQIDGGSIHFEGRDLLSLSQREMEQLRGGDIGMVFQDPMSCLDPVFTIGHQLTETIRSHRSVSRRDAIFQSITMLESVGIRNPKQLMKQYQYELSGGMRQRVVIAMALLCEPKLLIADEPTTALDVTIQDQIIRLLKQIQKQTGMAMIFITHNFGLVADICDKVTIMYGGTVMEQGSVDDVFYASAHPYTKGMLKAMPRVDFKTYEKLVPIEGDPINALYPPTGCVFHPRCKSCMEICKTKVPPETDLSYGHRSSCWLHDSSMNSKEVSANE